MTHSPGQLYEEEVPNDKKMRGKGKQEILSPLPGSRPQHQVSAAGGTSSSKIRTVGNVGKDNNDRRKDTRQKVETEENKRDRRGGCEVRHGSSPTCPVDFKSADGWGAEVNNDRATV